MNYEKIYTESDLRRVAPAVFADKPEGTLSDRYEFVPTIEVVRAMDERGFVVVHAQQTKPSKRNPSTAVHSLLFAPRDNVGLSVSGDNLSPTIYLRNSHNGQRPLEMRAGVYRFACANGLLVGDTFAEFKVRHMGEVQVDEIIEGTFEVIDDTVPMIENMMSVELSDKEISEFAREAITLRTKDDFATNENVQKMIAVRRDVDNSNRLWPVFNRIQENGLKQSLKTQATVRDKKTGRFKKRTIVSVPPRRVDAVRDYNVNLWRAAENRLAA